MREVRHYLIPFITALITMYLMNIFFQETGNMKKLRRKLCDNKKEIVKLYNKEGHITTNGDMREQKVWKLERMQLLFQYTKKKISRIIDR